MRRTSLLPVLVLASLGPAGDAVAILRPSYGGDLHIGTVGRAVGTHPTDALTFADWLAVEAIHAGLFRYGLSGGPEPDLLAELPAGSDHGRTWACRLRSDARYHDGGAVRARDVRASFVALSGTAHEWVARFVTVEVLDDWTFRLRTTVGLSPEDLAELLASPALVVTREGRSSRIGAGPFAVDRSAGPDGSLELVRYLGHHGGRPYLDAVELRAFSERSRVIEAFHYGKVDLVFEDSERYQAVERLPGPKRETVGLLLAPKRRTDAEAPHRRRLASPPRAELARRLPGRTSPATGLVPHEDGRGAHLPASQGRATATDRWFLGFAPELLPAAQTLAAALGGERSPWPVQPLDEAMLRRAIARSEWGRWDGVLLGWPHVDAWAPGALRTLADLAGVPRRPDPGLALRDSMVWVPLVDLARTAVYRRDLRGLRWTPCGTLELGDAWHAGTRQGEPAPHRGHR